VCFQCVTDWTLGSISEIQTLPSEIPYSERAGYEGTKSDDTFLHFENFCRSGLSHLGIKHSQDINLQGIWKEAEPFAVCQFHLFCYSNYCHFNDSKSFLYSV